MTQKENIPQAVLILAVEPMEGLELMAQRRSIDIDSGKISNITLSKLKNLTNGPSKLCQAMGIDTSLNGIELCGDELFIKSDEDLKQDEEIIATPRINIDYAGEDREQPWRFLVRGNGFVRRGLK